MPVQPLEDAVAVCPACDGEGGCQSWDGSWEPCWLCGGRQLTLGDLLDVRPEDASLHLLALAYVLAAARDAYNRWYYAANAGSCAAAHAEAVGGAI